MQDFTEYTNFEECVKYIEDYMVKNGPFDGILGHSQGALLAGAFPGMQNEVTPLFDFVWKNHLNESFEIIINFLNF